MCLRRFLSFISENKDKLKKGFSYFLSFLFFNFGAGESFAHMHILDDEHRLPCREGALRGLCLY